jgi:nucleotide-binding universal stress UspA family protein
MRESAAVEHSLLEEARASLHDTAAMLTQTTGVTATEEVVTGQVIATIRTAAEEADLLVLGAREARISYCDLVLVTTAERLIRTCRRPALVVKRVAGESPMNDSSCPSTFSVLFSAYARPWPARVAPHARISIVHALSSSLRSPGWPSPAQPTTPYDDTATRTATERRPSHRPTDRPSAFLTARTCLVERGDPSPVILAEAQAQDGRSHRHRQTGPAAGQGTPPWQHHSPSPDRINLRYPHGVTMNAPARATRTLLLAVDFSRPASRAVAYAIKLASILNLSLTVVHVLQAPPGFTSWRPATRRSLDPLRTKALLELGRVVRLANDHQVAAEYTLLAGVPEEIILQTAEEVRAALIVMGTHGRSGLDRLKLGSVADAVLRRGPLPGIHHPRRSRRPSCGPSTTPQPGSNSGGHGFFAFIKRGASACGRAGEAVACRGPAAPCRRRGCHGDRNRGTIPTALSDSRSGERVGEQLLLRGDPAASILAHAARMKARLIVMGTQGRRGMERLLLGSGGNGSDSRRTLSRYW